MNKTYEDFNARNFNDPDSYAKEYLAPTREVVQALAREKRVFKYTLERKEAFFSLNVDHYKQRLKTGVSWPITETKQLFRRPLAKRITKITKDDTGRQIVMELQPTPSLRKKCVIR